MSQIKFWLGSIFSAAVSLETVGTGRPRIKPCFHLADILLSGFSSAVALEFGPSLKLVRRKSLLVTEIWPQQIDWTWPLAFITGLGAFFSPCVLPLVPSWFAFITGLGYDQLKDPKAALNLKAKINLVFLPTLGFVLGLSLVYSLMGAASSILGSFLFAYGVWLRKTIGALIILFGLYLLLSGWLSLPFLDRERRWHLRKKPAHIGGSFLVGAAFAIGWIPCTTPMWGSLLGVAANKMSFGEGFGLLACFSLGLGLPFLTVSLFIGPALKALQRFNRFTAALSKFFGFILILLGLSFVTGWPKFFFTGIF